MIFTFTNPKYLSLLIIVPLLIFIHFYSLKKHNMRALKFANFDAISRINGIQFFSKNLTVLYLSVIIVTILALASAGLHINVIKSASSFSFVIAIDSSQSMETKDVLPDRMSAAKTAAKDFVDRAPISTKMGVISFSGVPFIEQEMTTNKGPIRAGIDRVEVSRVGGTNIMNAIIAAGTMFDNDDTKAMLIISDGQISVDTVESIIKYANQNEIVINTLGVGTVAGAENQLGYLSKLDSDSLEAMAYETGGKFAVVTTKEEFSPAIDDILKLTKRRVNVDMTYSLIFISAAIFIMLFILINFRFQGIP
jgi:Ca-activated chloride channel homolog